MSSEVSYAPIIEKMKWSFSRAHSFDDCPYKWYLIYIRHMKKEKMFFSSYGSFMHELLEEYFSGKLSKQAMRSRYLSGFSKEVPYCHNKKIFDSYFKSGLEYIKTIEPFPYKTLAVEEQGEIDIGGAKSMVIVDYIGELDGDIYIVDHKSKNLKPRSNRKTPTKSDAELDLYLRQLYIYSLFVKEKYGKYPAYLCFNCFRSKEFIVEPFSEEKLEDTIAWYTGEIKRISGETEFRPNIDWFFCHNLCDCSKHCEYFELNKG